MAITKINFFIYLFFKIKVTIILFIYFILFLKKIHHYDINGCIFYFDILILLFFTLCSYSSEIRKAYSFDIRIKNEAPLINFAELASFLDTEGNNLIKTNK